MVLRTGDKEENKADDDGNDREKDESEAAWVHIILEYLTSH